MFIGSLQNPCFCKYFSEAKAPVATLKPLDVGEPLTLVSGAKVVFRDSIADVNNWFSTNDLFLQKDYLMALEQAAPANLQLKYLIFYKNDQAVGLSLCQLLDFEGVKCFPQQELNFFQKWLSRQMNFNLLLCGNLLTTGEHAFHFDTNIAQEEAQLMLSEALGLLIKHLAKQNLRISATGIKDIFATSHQQFQLIEKQGFIPFRFQPSMIFDLPAHWHSFDDYIAAMSSKYRVRTRRALKKGADLQWRELDLEAIKYYQKEIYELYQQIAQSADFNAVQLPEDYFLTLKRQLTAQFRLFAAFAGSDLVGFYSTLQNETELEAHFLGYKSAINQHYHLYINILYRIVQQGIEGKAQRIVFARTAMEIKSSVGAVAHDLYCYLRPTKRFWNPIWRLMVWLLEPKVTWTPRHPFRAEAD